MRARDGGLLVSNDELRDHIWSLLRPKHFLKWKVRGCWCAAGGRQRGKGLAMRFEGDHIWSLLPPKHFLKWKMRALRGGGAQKG